MLTVFVTLISATSLGIVYMVYAGIKNSGKKMTGINKRKLSS